MVVIVNDLTGLRGCRCGGGQSGCEWLWVAKSGCGWSWWVVG